MKALILASGAGKRLRPLTYEIPKPLIKVSGKTILNYLVNNLIACGVREIIITTGAFEDKIKKFMREEFPSEKFPNVKVSYMNNPNYKTTNYICSMWLARGLVDDDVILVHGDLLFEVGLLRRLINEKYANCVLVNRKIKGPEKDFKAVIEDGRVVKIGVEFSGENAFFSVPLYKFSRVDFRSWLDEVGIFIKNGETKRYAEDAFNKISDKIMLHPVYFEDEFCVEIDTERDLETANKLVSNLVKARTNLKNE